MLISVKTTGNDQNFDKIMEVSMVELKAYAQDLANNLAISNRNQKFTLQDVLSNDVIIGQVAIKRLIPIIREKALKSEDLNKQVKAFITKLDTRILKEISPYSAEYASNDVAMLRSILDDVGYWLTNEAAQDARGSIDCAVLVYEYTADLMHNGFENDYVKGLFELAQDPLDSDCLILQQGYQNVVRHLKGLYLEDASNTEIVYDEDAYLKHVIGVINFASSNTRIALAKTMSLQQFIDSNKL
jgi:hypothetical protein